MQDVLSVFDRISQNGSWTGSQSDLAKLCSVSLRTIARHLKALRERGEIVIAGKRGKPLTYSRRRAVITVEHKPKSTKVFMAGTTAIVGALISTIFGVAHSKRRGRRQDASKQLFLDFEKGYSNAASVLCDGRRPVESRRADYHQMDRMEVPRRDPLRSRPGHHQSPPNRSTAARNLSDHSSQGLVIHKGTPNDYSLKPESPAPGSPPFFAGESAGFLALPPSANPARATRFKLPNDTTDVQLFDAAFVRENVFHVALCLKLVTVDEEAHVFGIVHHVLRAEKKTPAALLTYILNGGKRKTPWRSDIAEVDWVWSRRCLYDLDVPKAMQRRTANLDEEQIKRQQIQKLAAKYSSILEAK